MSKSIVIILTLVLALSTACTSMRIARDSSGSVTSTKSIRLYHLLFGIAQLENQQKFTELCAPNQFLAATYSSDWMDIGATVMTGGLFIPQSVKVDCR